MKMHQVFGIGFAVLLSSRGVAQQHEPAAVTPVQSSAGTPFAGAAVGTLAAVFPVDLATRFAGVTYAVPAGVTGQLVGGLSRNEPYDVRFRTVGSAVEVTVTPAAAGGSHRADDGGVLALGTLATKKP